MSIRTIKLNAGVSTITSESLNETQWSVSNLIRFYGHLPQKLGGWNHLNTQPLVGTCRGMHAWADIIGTAYIACGTEQRLQVLEGGAIIDITPVMSTTNPPTSGFSTVAGSTTVTITDTSYQPNVGDWVNLIVQVSIGGIILWGFYLVSSTIGATQYTIEAQSPATSTAASGLAPVFTTSTGNATVNVAFPNHGTLAGNPVNFLVSTTVGGVTIAGIYTVVSVVNANNFIINAATAATSDATAAMNGGNAQISYLLSSGYVVNTPISGYGIGDYGMGDYGLSSDDESSVGHLRQWSMDHWGQYLLASPTNGPIYYWNPPVPAPAQIISVNAPTMNASMFVIPQAQIIVALGAEIGGVQEPLLARWCDAGDFTDWTASTSNQAGSYQLSSGNRLVGGLPVGLGALLWTDTDVWYMQYIGFPLIFSFTQISSSGGLYAMRAQGGSAGQVAWLGTRGFFTYQTGGGVSSIECPVWDFIFQNIDKTQPEQAHCAVNRLFNEMAFFFPVDSGSEIYDPAMPLAYVKVNLVENVWDYGMSSQYQRTAWVEKNPHGLPVGTDFNGFIQQHEEGFDADGSAMIWLYQTGYFSMLDGEEFMFVDLMLPDFVLKWDGPSPPVINVSLLGTDYPIGLSDGEGIGQPLRDGPYTINTAQPGATLMVPVRLRARQIAIEFTGSDLGSFSRLGAVRIRFAPDGRN